MTIVMPFVPRARRAPRRRTVLLFLCLASLVAEIAAGLALASIAMETGPVAVDLLLAAGGIALLAFLLALRDVVRERRRTPAVVHALPPRDPQRREQRLIGP